MTIHRSPIVALSVATAFVVPVGAACGQDQQIGVHSESEVLSSSVTDGEVMVKFGSDAVYRLRDLAVQYHATSFGFFSGEMELDPFMFRVDRGQLQSMPAIEENAIYWAPFGMLIDGVRVSGTDGIIGFVGDSFSASGAFIECPSSTYWACCYCDDLGRARASCIVRTAGPQDFSDCQAGGIGATACSLTGCREDPEREVDPEASSQSAPTTGDSPPERTE